MEVLRPIGKVILEKMSIRFFSLDQLVAISGRGRVPVRRALERLCREGIVRKIEKYSVPTYQDPAAVSAKAPYQGNGYHGNGEFRPGRPPLQISYRLADRKKLAARIAPQLKEGTAAGRMWKVIRYKKIFCRRDLIVLAGANSENAKWYTKQLRKAGIIASQGKGGPGVNWVLVKDPGAKRPL